ncbi:MAG: SDR family oxidoreductase [Bacilli bacterium]|nr:SDR family oxidoreductase [Bacilli bacterium]
MKALITGASSGLGEQLAYLLASKGYDLILVARRKERLEEIKEKVKVDVQIIALDLSSTFNCMKLYNRLKKQEIDIVINNAGFGLFGEFCETEIDTELDMIDLNIKAVHTLTKLFLKDFCKKDSGYILNVASSAAYFSGPLMSTYYATKAYILHLTEAIQEELAQANKNVYVGCLCPGPFRTEFNKVAGVRFSLKSLSKEYVAEYALSQMFAKKKIIIPGLKMKAIIVLSKFLPRRLTTHINYYNQHKKGKND